jgi:hypothetical protein
LLACKVIRVTRFCSVSLLSASLAEGGAGEELFKGAFFVFLLVLQSRIHQFVEVAAAIFRLIGAFGD